MDNIDKLKNYEIKVFAVIDTNVIISSMLGNKKDTPPKQIMNLIQNGNIIPLFDIRMIDEYKDVLKRYFTDDIVQNKLKSILNYGFLVNDVEQTKVELIDKKDIPFFEVKESTSELESYLITGNTKHFPENQTVTPAETINMLNYMDRFIYPVGKESYLRNIVNTINSLKSDKYNTGKEMVCSILAYCGYSQELKSNEKLK